MTRDKHIGENSHLEEEHKEGWDRKVGEAGKAQLRKLRDGNTRPPDLPLEKPVYRSEATVRTGHGTTDLYQFGKGVPQGCILSP